LSVYESVINSVNASKYVPTAEEMARALAQMQSEADRKLFHLSKNPKLQEEQVRCFALGYQAGKTGYTPPPKTDEQLKQEAIANQKDASKRLMGVNSVLAGVSWDESRPEKPMQWMRNSFSPTDKRVALLLGDVGVGKTHAAVAYVSKMMTDFNTTGMFITAYDLLTALSNRKEEVLQAVERAKYLIVDDIGTHNSDFKGNDFRSYFENLFNKRHQTSRTTIITGNITIQDFKDIFGERVASRGAEIGAAIEFTGNDLRKGQQ